MPSNLRIMQAGKELHYRQVRELIEQYAASRNFDAALARLDDELQKLPEYYPLLLLAHHRGEPAGCVAIQQLTETICEMKRLYVPPEFRNLGIGRELIAAIIAGAKKLGYEYMRLDTHPSMQRAQDIYQQYGFREIGRYNQNPIPGIRFFELRLSGGV